MTYRHGQNAVVGWITGLTGGLHRSFDGGHDRAKLR